MSSAIRTQMEELEQQIKEETSEIKKKLMTKALGGLGKKLMEEIKKEREQKQKPKQEVIMEEDDEDNDEEEEDGDVEEDGFYKLDIEDFGYFDNSNVNTGIRLSNSFVSQDILMFRGGYGIPVSVDVNGVANIIGQQRSSDSQYTGSIKFINEDNEPEDRTIRLDTRIIGIYKPARNAFVALFQYTRGVGRTMETYDSDVVRALKKIIILKGQKRISKEVKAKTAAIERGIQMRKQQEERDAKKQEEDRKRIERNRLEQSREQIKEQYKSIIDEKPLIQRINSEYSFSTIRELTSLTLSIVDLLSQGVLIGEGSFIQELVDFVKSLPSKKKEYTGLIRREAEDKMIGLNQRVKGLLPDIERENDIERPYGFQEYNGLKSWKQTSLGKSIDSVRISINEYDRRFNDILRWRKEEKEEIEKQLKKLDKETDKLKKEYDKLKKEEGDKEERKKLAKKYNEVAKKYNDLLNEYSSMYGKKGGGKVIPVGIALDKITPYDEIWKYSNPKKVAEMAEKYLGKDDAKFVFRSSNPKKKYMVYDKKNEKWVFFGEMGYEDFTKHQDPKRRENYLTRTANMKGNWKDNKYSANNLSRNILW